MKLFQKEGRLLAQLTLIWTDAVGVLRDADTSRVGSWEGKGGDFNFL